jgi:hypothetical protein
MFLGLVLGEGGDVSLSCTWGYCVTGVGRIGERKGEVIMIADYDSTM